LDEVTPKSFTTSPRPAKNSRTPRNKRGESWEFAMLCYLFCLFALPTVCGIISVANEQLLTLSQLAKRLPRHRNDRPVHPSTCHRWRSPGVRGVRLECVRIGGIWHTSWEAFQRFCECLTALGCGGGTPPATSGRPIRGEEHQERVERELRDRGA
jgi:hypothetical protein